ncbi:PspC domain-containing protein [Candidatus Saccharibacteria bacterium]|nr:PspC domain-containing protein [Candidatus Saccharibacteria bacterium]
MAQKQRLYRLPKEGVIAGVASGFAKYFSIDVTLMRLIFIGALLLTNGFAVLLYLVLAVIMPTPDKAAENDNLGDKIENLAEEVKTSGRAQNLGSYVGIGLIIVGAWLLAGQFFPELAQIKWSVLWPSLVIVIGVLIIIRSKK